MGEILLEQYQELLVMWLFVSVIGLLLVISVDGARFPAHRMTPATQP